MAGWPFKYRVIYFIMFQASCWFFETETILNLRISCLYIRTLWAIHTTLSTIYSTYNSYKSKENTRENNSIIHTKEKHQKMPSLHFTSHDPSPLPPPPAHLSLDLGFASVPLKWKAFAYVTYFEKFFWRFINNYRVPTLDSKIVNSFPENLIKEYG